MDIPLYTATEKSLVVVGKHSLFAWSDGYSIDNKGAKNSCPDHFFYTPVLWIAGRHENSQKSGRRKTMLKQISCRTITHTHTRFQNTSHGRLLYKVSVSLVDVAHDKNDQPYYKILPCVLCVLCLAKRRAPLFEKPEQKNETIVFHWFIQRTPYAPYTSARQWCPGARDGLPSQRNGHKPVKNTLQS